MPYAIDSGKRFFRSRESFVPRALSDDDIADFRERLCDAAETLFAEHGTEAVTIRQLAEKIGVSPMTPYRYFEHKDAILAAVRARGFQRHAEALETAWRDTPGDAGDKARAVGAAYVRFAFDHPQAYTLMFDINQPTEGQYPDFERAAERSRRTMTLYLEPMAAAGQLRGDPVLVGHMFWAAIHGAIMLQLTGRLGRDCEAGVLIPALMETISAAVFTGDAET
jgi:AcrR family transcriptional regulator